MYCHACPKTSYIHNEYNGSLSRGVPKGHGSIGRLSLSAQSSWCRMIDFILHLGLDRSIIPGRKTPRKLRCRSSAMAKIVFQAQCQNRHGSSIRIIRDAGMCEGNGWIQAPHRLMIGSP